MKVVLAGKTGFCFGVKRAVTMAGSAIKNNRPIYSLGSIIHNKQVVEALSKKGLKAINSADSIDKGTLVISSHGLSPRIAALISKKGIKIIDTTCPFVLKAQDTAKRLKDEGYHIIIVGDAAHPEVKALVDFAGDRAFVIKDEEAAAAFKPDKGAKFSIIAQTTQSTENFSRVVKIISGKVAGGLEVFNTICKDAEERQAQAKKLAKEVDAMVVVGGRDSANTRRLFEVCKKILKKSYHAETEDDVKAVWFKGLKKVGVTSGASTPEFIIKRVVKKIQKKGVV